LAFVVVKACREWSVRRLERVPKILYAWVDEHRVAFVRVFAVLIWVLSMAFFFTTWMALEHGDITVIAKDPGFWVGLPFFAGVAGYVSFLLGALSFVALVMILTVLAHTLRLLTLAVLLVPLIAATLLFALVQALVVGAKLLLLLPLAVLVIVTRAVEIKRGIFYTCARRSCTYRGVPAHRCADCGTVHDHLRPNLYGLFHHNCGGCDQPLPTLDVLGRDRLAQQCRGCNIPLLGKHAGRARERLVAIAGGPGSGKTCYLYAAVDRIVNGPHGGNGQLRGKIDDDAQAQEFRRVKDALAQGTHPAKTAEVASAFLLFTKAGKTACQLYLYDAPGEEFSSLSAVAQQDYLPLLAGIIFLVDPATFDGAPSAPSPSRGALSLREVVNATVPVLLAGLGGGRDGRLLLRAAVVISKADLDFVRKELGDVGQGRPPTERCREAILRWGGGAALRALEQRFAEVEYFACSPLGGPAVRGGAGPFGGAGVVEPIAWILAGRR
jgi:hypothetical protein